MVRASVAASAPACLQWDWMPQKCLFVPLIATLIGKVVFSRGVPEELIEALGGDAAAVGRLEHCSPHVAPDAPFVEPGPPRVLVRQNS